MSQGRWTGKSTDMLPEIAAAVGFLSSLLRTRGCVSEQRLKVFSGALQEALTGEPTPKAPAPFPAGTSFLPAWDTAPHGSSSGTQFPSSTGSGLRAPITLGHVSRLGPWRFWWGAAGAGPCPGVRFRLLRRQIPAYEGSPLGSRRP